jgi:hypothetical protein
MSDSSTFFPLVLEIVVVCSTEVAAGAAPAVSALSSASLADKQRDWTDQNLGEGARIQSSSCERKLLTFDFIPNEMRIQLGLSD